MTFLLEIGEVLRFLSDVWK